MTEQSYKKLAQILVDHSTSVHAGDRVAIETTTNAESLVREIYELVLQRGGHPHVLLNLPEQEKILFTYANDDQLTYTPAFQKLVTDQFEAYIRVRAEIDPEGIDWGYPRKNNHSGRRGWHQCGIACYNAGQVIPCAGHLPKFLLKATHRKPG